MKKAREVKRLSKEVVSVNGVEFDCEIAKNILVGLWNKDFTKLEIGHSVNVDSKELIKMMGGK